MRHNGKDFGKVEVIGDRIPKNCGYQKKFKFNIDMNSNGIPGDCIDWCEKNCEYKWGWWFEDDGTVHPTNHWEHQRAWMSFANKKEAMRFWVSVGIQNYGDKD